MVKFPTYFVIRKRIVKMWLKYNGWRFRGQDPPSKWRHILLISPAEGSLLKMQNRWMTYLTATPSNWVELNNSDQIDSLLKQKHTVLIRWSESMDHELLSSTLLNARKKGVRISACAWDTTHKAIKFHSPFRPSLYPERDIRYLTRFFRYFIRI